MTKHPNHSWWILTGLLPLALIGPLGAMARGAGDPSLVLHYTFDADPGDTVKDQSSYGNDGKIVAGTYLEEHDGRRGVLRFDGEKSQIDCGDADSLNFTGDTTLEMWLRLNTTQQTNWGFIFGEHPGDNFNFGDMHTLRLWYGQDEDNVTLPVDRRILSGNWAHIAVVVEYPRFKVYQNGELVRDAYMPVSGVTLLDGRSAFIGGAGEHFCEMDLDELRLYRRALSPAEIGHHAQDEHAPVREADELSVAADWYTKQVTLQLTCKGEDCSSYSAGFTLRRGNRIPVGLPIAAKLAEPFPGCGRYVATASFALDELEQRGHTAVGMLLDSAGHLVRIIHKHVFLQKPPWIDTDAGRWDGVAPPWTAVGAQEEDGRLQLHVWGRRYEMASTPLWRQVETDGAELLANPMQFTGKANGQNLVWDTGSSELVQSDDTGAVIQQQDKNDLASLSIRGHLEYDGFMVFDCQIQAKQDLALENLGLEIPLWTRHAKLCFGHDVYPNDPKIPMKRAHIGAVNQDLAFGFSPSIWVGDNQRGLAWQAESDEHWHPADPQQAIEILPRGDITTFRANFVSKPKKLAAGQTLNYRFALQATPVKPFGRDGWDLRIVRSHLWNQSVTWPDRMIEGLPALAYLKKNGARRIYTNIIDVWPHPLPVHETFARKIHRLIDAVHDNELRIHMYMIHERFRTTVAAFDPYGGDMIKRPAGPYPLPVNRDHYYTITQAGIDGCPNSQAYRDAYIHSLAERLDRYGDDGVYLDGTTHISACQNTLHGCGYRAADGSMRKTYPVFAIRDFMKRLHAVIKQRQPDGVLDVHSWTLNTFALAYADLLWTGEQWWHLKVTGTDYLSKELPLDMFRAMFMGYQIGVPTDMLAYRLTSRKKTRHHVLSIALLHDVPVRAILPHGEEAGEFLKTTFALWKMRDRFGAQEAIKLFYWENEQYVRMSPDKCHATLLQHPDNGVLALISNLNRDAQTVRASFDLNKLGIMNPLEVFNGLTNEPVALSDGGTVTVSLGSEEWVYVWLRPAAAN